MRANGILERKRLLSCFQRKSKISVGQQNDQIIIHRIKNKTLFHLEMNPNGRYRGGLDEPAFFIMIRTT